MPSRFRSIAALLSALFVAPALFAESPSPSDDALPLGVQSCDTECQSAETDCDLACDQVVACVEQCKKTSAACTEQCRTAPPPSKPVASAKAAVGKKAPAAAGTAKKPPAKGAAPPAKPKGA